MTSQAVTTTVLAWADRVAGLAQQEPVNNFGDTRGGALAGPLGLFLIILLLIATVLLIRNMNSRLRRLPREFPDRRPDGAEASHDDAAPVSPAPGGSEHGTR